MANVFETEWERPEFDSVPSLAENAVYLLPGCDPVLLRKSLQFAYRDFCRRSAALRTWRRIDLSEDETRYPVVPVLSGEIDCVTQVSLGFPRRELHGWRVFGDPPILELRHGYPPHDVFVGRSSVSYVQDKTNVGSLPVETEVAAKRKGSPWALWVEAIEIPHIGEERAPKAFLRRYGDAIISGALARMFPMAGKPWTDAEQARQHAMMYANAVNEARMRSMHGNGAANASAMPTLDMTGMV